MFVCLFRECAPVNSILGTDHLLYFAPPSIFPTHNIAPFMVYPRLAFTGYCQYQLCVVYGIQKGGWGRDHILRKSRALVLQ